jgi:multidrug transporter EmrE-like cation transporter
MATISSASTLSLWFGVLAISVACDVGATAYLKVAGDRLQGFSFFWAAVLAVAVFAPSIMTFGYAMKIGPSYVATVGIWAVGVYAANAVVGVLTFGDPFSWRMVLGVAAACVTVVLLKPVA